MHIVLLSTIALLFIVSAVVIAMLVWYAAPGIPLTKREFLQMTPRGCYVYTLKKELSRWHPYPRLPEKPEKNEFYDVRPAYSSEVGFYLLASKVT